RASELYVRMHPRRVLYLSGGFLERIENEAELAGILAHELAHSEQPPIVSTPPQATVPIVVLPQCVLASDVNLPFDGQREREQLATQDAAQSLKRAGYEPSAILDLLSKLAYEHRSWAHAIVPEDLSNLRSVLQSDVIPDAGYVIGSSQFTEQHRRLLVA